MSTLVIGIIIAMGLLTALIVFIIYSEEPKQILVIEDYGNLVSVVIVKGSSNPENVDNYVPKEVRVVLGINNTVQWINQDETLNSVVSDTGLFDSGAILPVGRWTYTFEKTGEYGYHAEPHPWMKGKVIVEPRE